MFDLISSIELTASAVAVIFGMAMAFGRSGTERTVIGSVLLGWFTAVIAAGATGVLYYGGTFGVPGLAVAVLLPIGLLALVGFRTTWGRSRIDAANPAFLIAIQAVRVLGVSFVILHAVGRLPAPFAPIAGWGDILVGLAALPVAAILARRGAAAYPIARAWNIVGLLDLAVAVALGAMSSRGPIQIFAHERGSEIMMLLPWIIIPCFLVPALSFVHLVNLRQLAPDYGLAKPNGA